MAFLRITARDKAIVQSLVMRTRGMAEPPNALDVNGLVTVAQSSLSSVLDGIRDFGLSLLLGCGLLSR